jgi:cell division protein FtsW
LAIVALLLTSPNRVDRFISWLHPEETKETSGYQGWQSRLALAHGGTAGVGFTLSTQKQVLPEHHTDFIFAIIGEEFGLIGTVTVTWVLMLVFLSSLFIAWHAADTFGQFLGVGISFLFGLQSLVNVGVVTGLLPNKGLPLPFVSYGGSNLTMMLMCAGILVSIARRAGVTSEADSSVMSPVNAPVIRLA